MICYSCGSENLMKYGNFSGEECMCLNCGEQFQIDANGKIIPL